MLPCGLGYEDLLAASKSKERGLWFGPSTAQITDGMLRTLKLPAYSVPKSPVRLLSTSSLLQTYSCETILADSTRMVLSGVEGDPTRSSVVALINPRDNLPSATGYNYGDTGTAPAAAKYQTTTSI
jgi:hypothetical protein